MMNDVASKRTELKKRVVTKENVCLWDIFTRTEALYRMLKDLQLNKASPAESNLVQHSNRFPFQLPVKTKEDVSNLENFISDPDNYQNLVSPDCLFFLILDFFKYQKGFYSQN